jgi:hypothetical protein
LRRKCARLKLLISIFAQRKFTMRLTTEFWVSALLRRAFTQGCFGAVEKRGATEAGAVFIVQRERNGGLALYCPAPQSDYSGDIAERRFTRELTDATPADIERRLEKEARFDSDLWVVEVEAGTDRLEEWIGPTTPA